MVSAGGKKEGLALLGYGVALRTPHPLADTDTTPYPNNVRP